ncbi:pro-glucagon-like isoform X2 [Paroedura picta]|uniref:pro-glucagon-like isoform X2 n=1 Tax=Paroedura picta TaxID=143630 RepID=UPI00405706D2
MSADHASLHNPVPKKLTHINRWKSYATESAHSFSSNVKRHSEGTFTSDFTQYLDKMKAKDFVHWLINTKRYSSTKRFIKEKPSIVSFLPGF